jgi:hypothetical protein
MRELRKNLTKPVEVQRSVIDKNVHTAERSYCVDYCALDLRQLRHITTDNDRFDIPISEFSRRTPGQLNVSIDDRYARPALTKRETERATESDRAARDHSDFSGKFHSSDSDLAHMRQVKRPTMGEGILIVFNPR